MLRCLRSSSRRTSRCDLRCSFLHPRLYPTAFPHSRSACFVAGYSPLAWRTNRALPRRGILTSYVSHSGSYLWHFFISVGARSQEFKGKSLTSDDFKAFFLSYFAGSVPEVAKVDWDTWFYKPG